MKRFELVIPIAGYAIVYIEAESEEEARQKFRDGDVEVTNEDVEMWDAYEHIIEGNIIHIDNNDLEVIEV